MEKWVR